jgi:valyl-tRNA synthetase
MDEHAHMNANAGQYAGLDRYEARKRVLADLQEQGFLVGEKDHALSLGKCERCGTVVEPRLSEQWFIKIKPLAQKAIEAIESGEITIVPDNYRQIYLNWMNNIYDWCISRQLWWGHRIPAWTCGDCKEIIVARETPAKCSKCGGMQVEQVSDVLDTWFSSGLLPFTTLGWPEKTRDHAADHSVRDSFFLGGAHDHVWLPFYGWSPAGSRDQEGQRLGRQEERQRALPAGLHPRTGARC